MIFEVCDMRAAGKPGYVAKITDKREKQFLAAKDYSAHGASAKQVSYEISEDGIYEICDANFGGRKRKISFVLIRNGNDVFWADSLQEVESHADCLDGKVEVWAVAPKEVMISSHTVSPAVESSYPGLKPEEDQVEDSVDVEIATCKLQEERFIQVKMKSDNAFKLFMPDMKNRVRGRKWNESSKSWLIPVENGLLLRELIEERTIRTNGIRMPMNFKISTKAKEAMLMDV
jgi:hypothetical protein